MGPRKRGRLPGTYEDRERLVFFVGFRVPRGLYRQMVEYRAMIPYENWSDAFRAFARQTVAEARQSTGSRGEELRLKGLRIGGMNDRVVE